MHGGFIKTAASLYIMVWYCGVFGRGNNKIKKMELLKYTKLCGLPIYVHSHLSQAHYVRKKSVTFKFVTEIHLPKDRKLRRIFSSENEEIHTISTWEA